MTALVAVTLTLSALALCLAFYAHVANEARATLKERLAPFVGANSKTAAQKAILVGKDRVRISLIEQNGTVAFDAFVSAVDLANHADREEVIAALKDGAGESKRFSDTIKEETYYYAIRLSDGAILRAAITTSSVFGAFASAIPTIIGVVAVMIVLSFAMASRLTQKIIDPINKADINAKFEAPYKEFEPFAKTIAAQREQIETELAEKTKLVEMRREFSANVSHELKTPLTSIYGYAEMLSGDMVKKGDKREIYAKIKDEAARLIALIEDIIKISELDEGERSESFAPIELNAIASDAINALALKSLERGVRVTLKGGGVILGARSMIFETFYNLIDNAVKYNKPNGLIEIEITQNDGKIFVTIADNGIGIPKEAQSRVFERFYRVDKSRSKKTGGTGLGLAIVKHIVMVHNGEIRLKSKEGEGASFTLAFNAA